MIDGLTREEYFDFLERHEERFRALEKLLKVNPTAKAWRKVMHNLEHEWPQDDPDFLNIVLPHVERVTHRWHLSFPGYGARQRVDPIALLSRHLGGEPQPFLILSDHVTVTGGHWRSRKRLSECPYFTNTHELTFSHVTLTLPAAIDYVLTASVWPVLRTLRLAHCTTDASAVAAVMSSEVAPQLHKLVFDHTAVDAGSLGAILDVIEATEVTELHLSNASLSVACIDMLIASADMLVERLTSLDVTGNRRVSNKAQDRLFSSALVGLMPIDYAGHPRGPKA